MAGSVNKVILIGNVGKDPETKSLQNGGEGANLGVPNHYAVPLGFFALLAGVFIRPAFRRGY